MDHCRVQGSGIRVQGSGFRIQGFSHQASPTHHSRWRRRTAWLAALALLLAPVWAPAQVPEKLREGDLRTLQDAFVSLADRVRPSVVAIRTYRMSRRGDTAGDGFRVPNSQGSGVIFRADGYILSNHHVVEDSDEIRVILSSSDELPATLLGSDPRSDLAVLRVDRLDLRPARLGDLSRVRQGQWTFAFGNPFGLANRDGRISFTVGNVSALDRQLTDQLDPTGVRYYGNLIETTSSINPGNSGGPLFSLDGEVIGVVTAIESRSGVNEGMGFAIPISDRTRRIIDTLAAGQRVRYGYLGVTIEDVNEALRRELNLVRRGGAVIRDLSDENGAAAAASLRANDVIVEYDGVPIEGADHLVRLVGSTQVGTTANVKYVRDGRVEAVSVKLGERALTPFTAAARDPAVPLAPWFGAILAEPTDQQLAQLKLTRDDAGIVVVDVPTTTPAYAFGLRSGELIMRLDGKRVRTLGEFAEAANRAGRHIRAELSDGRTIIIEDN